MPFPPGLTALIADDEEPILLLAKACLEQKGFSVSAASAGRQALGLAINHTGTLDLLLMDIVLPDINGPELTEQILQYHPEAKVVFISGYGVGAEAALRHRHRESIYLKKPFGVKQLHQAVEEALGLLIE